MVAANYGANDKLTPMHNFGNYRINFNLKWEKKERSKTASSINYIGCNRFDRWRQPLQTKLYAKINDKNVAHKIGMYICTRTWPYKHVHLLPACSILHACECLCVCAFFIDVFVFAHFLLFPESFCGSFIIDLLSMKNIAIITCRKCIQHQLTIYRYVGGCSFYSLVSS